MLLPVPGYRGGFGGGLILAGLRGGVLDDPFPAGGYAVLVEPCIRMAAPRSPERPWDQMASR